MHAVTYELIKECSRSGARLGRLHTPHGTFENADVYAGRHAGNSKNPVAGRTVRHGQPGNTFQYLPFVFAPRA